MSSIIDTLDLCRRTTCSYRPALCGNPAQRARLLKLHVTLERQVLRTGTPNSVDRALHQGLRLTLFASVHETAVDIRLGTQAARLLLARLILGAFWLGLILTVIIYILEDDALEKWCKRSSFRLAMNSKPYEEQEELAALHSAFSEVL